MICKLISINTRHSKSGLPYRNLGTYAVHVYVISSFRNGVGFKLVEPGARSLSAPGGRDILNPPQQLLEQTARVSSQGNVPLCMPSMTQGYLPLVSRLPRPNLRPNNKASSPPAALRPPLPPESYHITCGRVKPTALLLKPTVSAYRVPDGQPRQLNEEAMTRLLTRNAQPLLQ